MVTNISQLVNRLFQKETLDEVSESELRYFIRQYPYAGTGHLLLTKKLQLEGEKRAFEREIAVTSIYFNNPAWLQFILNEPNGNGNDDLIQTRLPVHPSGIEKQIVPEDEPIVVSSDELNNSTREHDNVTAEPVNETSDYNGDEQPTKRSSGDLFYDDGEVFAEFIVEEANEEIRLNEETLNAPWETEEEDTGEQKRSEEDESVSDEELRDNFEKRKHLTFDVVSGNLERPEALTGEPDKADYGRPGHEGEYEDTQMVDRPDLISFEAQKASQRDPLPVESEQPVVPENPNNLSNLNSLPNPYNLANPINLSNPNNLSFLNSLPNPNRLSKPNNLSNPNRLSNPDMNP